MNKSIIIFLIFCIISISAIAYTPPSNIDMRNEYTIVNGTNITADNFFGNATYANTSGFSVNSTYAINATLSVNSSFSVNSTYAVNATLANVATVALNWSNYTSPLDFLTVGVLGFTSYFGLLINTTTGVFKDLNASTIVASNYFRGSLNGSYIQNMNTECGNDFVKGINFSNETVSCIPVEILTYANIENSIGNWSEEQASLPNLTLSEIESNLGNWSKGQLSLPNLTLSEIESNIGNWSNEKNDYWNRSSPFNASVNASYVRNMDLACDPGDVIKSINLSNESIACQTPAGGGDITSVQSGDPSIYNGSDTGAVLLRFNITPTAENIGNWSKGQLSLPNLTLSEIEDNIGNWSDDQSEYWNRTTPFNASVNASFVANYDLSCPVDTYMIGTNMTNESIVCASVASGAAGLWTNSSDNITSNHSFVGIGTHNPTNLLEIFDQVPNRNRVVLVKRNMSWPDTDSSVMEINQQNSDDNQVALRITQNGGATGLEVHAINVTSRSASFFQDGGGANLNFVYFGRLNSSSGENMIQRNLDSDYTAAPVLQIRQINSGDDQIALKIEQEAISSALSVIITSSGASAISINANSSQVDAGLGRVNAGLGSFFFRRNVISAISGGAVVAIVQDNVGDDQPALKVQNDNSTGASIIMTTFPQFGNDPMCWDGSGESGLGDCSSTIELKKDVVDLEIDIDNYKLLQPRAFRWKDNNVTDTGLIAEEVNATNPYLARYREGAPKSVKYDSLAVVNLKMIQYLMIELCSKDSSYNFCGSNVKTGNLDNSVDDLYDFEKFQRLKEFEEEKIKKDKYEEIKNKELNESNGR